MGLSLIKLIIVSALIGKFYEGDCYIILKTFIDDSNALNWNIWYWIGQKAPVCMATSSGFLVFFLVSVP